MAGNTKSLYEDDKMRIVKRGSNGLKDPAHIAIHLHKPEDMMWSRVIKLTVDELFDLTEVLDDICDDIEDMTYEEPRDG